MTTSLAITDAILFICAVTLAWRRDAPISMRLAAGTLAVAAALGVLRFSGLYPMVAWHRLFSIFGGCVALPLLAVGALWPGSAVATQRQFALILMGGAALPGLLVSGVYDLRLYDQAVALASLLIVLVCAVRSGTWQRSAAALCLLGGSVLFAAKVGVPPWLQPGDLLHLGMAAGLMLLLPRRATAFS